MEEEKPKIVSNDLFDLIISQTMIRDTELSSEDYLKKLGLEGQDENKALEIAIFNLIIALFKTIFSTKVKFTQTIEQFKLGVAPEMCEKENNKNGEWEKRRSKN